MAYQTTNTRCLIAAAKNLGIKLEILDPNKNLLRLSQDGQTLFFANYSTPFNDASVEKICKDKEFAHFILDKKVRMPRANGFFDPLFNEDSEIHGGSGTFASIAENIKRQFTMPVVIKPNSRSKGQNVTLCTEGRHIFDAVEKIFDHHSEYYDYVALAEEYIAPDREFRVVIFNREIVLMYEKDVREATFVGNLSPLHWQGAKAVVVTDKEIIGKMSDFIAPIFNELDINYAGLDVILGRDGKFYLIEVNTLIGFSHFVKDNGDAPIIDLYENILAKSFNLPIKNHPLDGSVKNDFSSQGAMVRE